MSRLLVQEYLAEIDRLRQWSGSVTEGVISEAFKDLLKAWSRQLGWQFTAQFEFASTQRSRIRPDGTIFHAIGLPHGYWEAKDTADDLDTEIGKKLSRGYPQSNIIFENSETAVLIQNRAEVFRRWISSGQCTASIHGQRQRQNTTPRSSCKCFTSGTAWVRPNIF